MIAALSALAPVGLVIALGWVLKRSGFPGDGFWQPAERVTYYVLMPALIIGNLAGAPVKALDIAPIVAILVTALLLAAAVMMALRRALTDDGPAFTSLFQGAIRGNIYAGMAASVALHGDAGLTLAAVAVAAERTLLEADVSRKRRREVIDKMAAAIILQGALDQLALP